MAEPNSYVCLNTGDTLTINFNGFSPSIGQTYLTWDGESKYNCVTINTLVDEPFTSNNLVSLKSDCFTCYTTIPNQYGVLTVSDCYTGGKLYIDLLSFGFLPEFRTTYFIEYTNETGQIIKNCVTIADFRLFNEPEYYKFIAAGIMNFIIPDSTPILEIGCESCLLNNGLFWVVRPCSGSGNIIVEGPPNLNLRQHLITYTDGLDQFCGIVREQVYPPQSPFGTFVTDLGEPKKEGPNCETCLSTVAEKRILVDCLDSNHIEVVWNSLLSIEGTVSNLSVNDGCFVVSGLTESATTLSGFLNFDPQPDCQDCIQCNGLPYNVVTCGGSGKQSTIFSYQYLTAGQIIKLPDGVCYTVIGVGDITNSYRATVYSVETYDDCGTCGADNRLLFNAKPCPATDGFGNILITASDSFGPGDVIKIQWGDSDYSCVEITSEYGIAPFGSIAYNSNTTTPYLNCSTCTEDSNYVALSLLKCNTNEHGFYRVSLTDWQNIYGFGPFDLPNKIFSDTNGNCYYVVNDCPITPELTYPILTLENVYYTCETCINSQYREEARSANTETFVCILDCSGNTISVSTPHPVWTDPYGTPVTQLNMTTLGGVEGLNS
jgi:hypothetical protein